MNAMKWSLLALVAVLLAGSFGVGAGEECAPPYKGSKEFDRLTQLVGAWEGTGGMAKEGEKIRVEYRVTAGGSAIVETLLPGTPHEMVSVYHDENGALAMTHYCMLQNRPHMKLAKATENSIEFVLGESPGIDPAKDPHMHALTITFVDKDHLNQRWTMFEAGKAKGVAAFDLSRVH